METSLRPIRARFAIAGVAGLAGCAILAGLAALAGFAAPLRAEVPGQDASAPERGARGPADLERWVRLLERESANPDAAIARSARAALDALGEGGRRGTQNERANEPEQRGAPRASGSRGERGRSEARGPDGSDLPPRPLGPRPPRDRGAWPRGRDDGAHGDPFSGDHPPRCGPGCCLHGRGARDGGPPPPFPRGLPPGPPPRGPRDFAPRPPRNDGPRDRRPGPGFDGPRPPRPPLPDRDEPSRPHRSPSKET